MKIVAVTMVKNEENIIESFVRHAETFADHVIVFNHGSTDGTKDILTTLHEEMNGKLILYPEVMDTVMTVNMEMFNHMIRYAFEQLEADIVLPLDADEFPMLLSGGNVRDYLEGLSLEQCYRVHFIPFSLTENWRNDVFVPLLFDRRKKISSDTDIKTFLTRKLYFENELEVELGNHLCAARKPGVDTPVKDLYPELFYAHFAFRNREHLESKLVIRWLSLIMRNDVTVGMAFQYQDGFDKILAGGKLSKEEMDWFCMNNMYAGYLNKETLEDVQKQVEIEDTSKFFPAIQLKYSHLVQDKSNYVLLMEFAQQVIDRYKEVKAQNMHLAEREAAHQAEKAQQEEKFLAEKNQMMAAFEAEKAQLKAQMEAEFAVEKAQLEAAHLAGKAQMEAAFTIERNNLAGQVQHLHQAYGELNEKYVYASRDLAGIRGSKAWKLIQTYRKLVGKHDPTQD